MTHSLIVSGKRSFWLGCPARLAEDAMADKFKAWAETVVRTDPDLKWILGNFVEADRANSNGHIFPLGDLVTAQETLQGKPLTMLHADQYIVGYYAGGKLLDAQGETLTAEMVSTLTADLADTGPRPYMEAVAGIWHRRFDDEYKAIRRAHGEGNLFFSMEAVPPTVSCPTCKLTADFDGLESETYCEHMNGPILPKILNQPVFCGGAIIIPPVRPGWGNADVKTISQAIKANAERAEALYDAARELTPHLTPGAWEGVMGELLKQATKETQP